MATTDNAIPIDIAFFNHLSPYLGLDDEQLRHMKTFVEKGFIQRDRLVEHAIAATGNLEIVSIHGQDFCDGSDAKSTTSVARNNDKDRGKWTMSFTIRKTQTKTGSLRVIAYNQHNGEFYYFVIPNHEFAGKKQVEIVIESFTGIPGWDESYRFTGKPCRHLKWWNYEVATFEELSTKTF